MGRTRDPCRDHGFCLRSLSKNEGLVDNIEVKNWFQGEVAKILANRETPLTLILENSPGQKWHPNDK